MKIIDKCLRFAAACAALTTGVIAPAAPASAATPQPKWDVVAIEIGPSPDSVTPATTKDVGGGSWTYGTEVTSSGQERCYSYYFHGSKMHHATAKISRTKNTAPAFAGQTAKASATAGIGYTCYAFWSVDE